MSVTPAWDFNGCDGFLLMPSASAFPPFLSGGGSLGGLIRGYDWAATPLGSPETWPQSLRSALSICLNSSFPTAIYWGPELRLLYNEAWSVIPAERHPWALGRPAGEVWQDIWHVVGPQFERVLETGEGFSTYDQMLPMVRDGRPCETYWNYSITPIRGEDGAVAGIFNQGNETTEAVLARRNAQAEIDRLGRMFAQAPGAVAILKGPSHEFEIVNSAYEALVGRNGIAGRTVAEALPEVVGQGFVDLLDQVLASGQTHVGRAVPVSLQRQEGIQPELRYVDFVYQPLSDSAGAASGIFVQATDVTEQKQAEEAQSLLLREMDHRVKNLFSIFTGMVSLSARAAGSVRDLERALKGRLAALSKAHDLIRGGAASGEIRQEATLGALLQSLLAPHTQPGAVEQISLSGGMVPIGPRAMTSLALILHELATNAAKYGALSSADGRLAVSWQLADDQLKVDWDEWLPGAGIAAPVTEGFGSRLARASATSQLGGAIEFDWRPQGLRVVIDLPSVEVGR